ncbi:glycosyltransferase family 2 protein [Francisella philomiragia]|uniref:Glycosyltransferase like 2 family protein n=1 Tax=Francisella philomiragia TaxID=28110 RepID=A0A0B6D8Q0_9GAMM|nr:glycosyltransferase family 2 protein [Francisella philomiragia]AJI54003.1 glycosyltransferase like 2 family protein [Francisella philomiragia]
MNSLVSIITPSYNSEKYISNTIESVITQTYQNWEMIIVDDCSTDSSCDIAEKYTQKDTRIKLIKLNKNSGPAKARNRAIKEAKGRYISFLDSDDVWYSHKLEQQVQFMESNNLSVTCSSYYTIDANGKKNSTRIVPEKILYSDMLKSNYIGNLTGIYDCIELGKIYADNVGHEDYTLWLKVVQKTKSVNTISEPLAEYRVLNSSTSSNKFKTLSWQWNIYRNILNLDVYRSSYYFICYVYYALKKRI